MVREGLEPADVLAVLESCARVGGWRAALLEQVEGALRARTLSCSEPGPLIGLASSTPEDGLVPIAEVGARLRTLRHDLNNPLAAAFAEVQLLLMDVHDPEVRRALASVEAQLRRIRDGVAAFALPGAARPGGAGA